MAQTLYGTATFTSNGGFNIGSQSAIDSRITVKQEQHLFELDTYNGVKLYTAMIVSAEDTGAVYVLTNRDIYDSLSKTYLTKKEDGTTKTVADLTEDEKTAIKTALEAAWKKVGDFDPSQFEITWEEIPASTGA